MRTAQKTIAAFLVLGVLMLSAPRPVVAQGGTIAGLAACLLPSLISFLPTLGIKLVPVKDPKLEEKSCYDQIMIGILKDVIKLMRDMVLQWIVTGRFGGPVFSTSFAFDASRVAENASRVFLSKLSGIDFCAGINVPSLQNYSLNFAVTVSCSLSQPLQATYLDSLLALTGVPSSAPSSARLTLEDELALTNPQNNKLYAYIFTLDEQQREITRAVSARKEEYAAGQGFLDIKDGLTGLVKTPGNIAGKLVQEQTIVAPLRDAGVAHTLQQAITEIITTAIQVLVNKGLAGISGG